MPEGRIESNLKGRVNLKTHPKRGQASTRLLKDDNNICVGHSAVGRSLAASGETGRQLREGFSWSKNCKRTKRSRILLRPKRNMAPIIKPLAVAAILATPIRAAPDDNTSSTATSTTISSTSDSISLSSSISGSTSTTSSRSTMRSSSSRNSVRGPCPALNTLANHGYINHDGRNININDLAQAGQDVFGLSIEAMHALIFPNIETGIEIETDEEGEISFDLDALFLRNGIPNHDSSLFSVDDYFEESAPFSEDLFDQFVSSVDGDTATIVDVVDFQIARLEHSCENNREFFNVLDGNLLNAIASEKFALFLLQSQPPQKFTLQTKLNLKQAEKILKDNRLPKDFVSRKDIGLIPIQFAEAFFSDMVQYTFAEICKALFARSTKCPSIVPLLTQCTPPEV